MSPHDVAGRPSRSVVESTQNSPAVFFNTATLSSPSGSSLTAVTVRVVQVAVGTDVVDCCITPSPHARDMRTVKSWLLLLPVSW